MIIRKDANTEYPDVNEIISTRRQSATMPSNQSRSTYFTQSVMLKITLLVNPLKNNPRFKENEGWLCYACSAL